MGERAAPNEPAALDAHRDVAIRLGDQHASSAVCCDVSASRRHVKISSPGQFWRPRCRFARPEQRDAKEGRDRLLALFPPLVA